MMAAAKKRKRAPRSSGLQVEARPQRRDGRWYYTLADKPLQYLGKELVAPRGASETLRKAITIARETKCEAHRGGKGKSRLLPLTFAQAEALGSWLLHQGETRRWGWPREDAKQGQLLRILGQRLFYQVELIKSGTLDE
jgi:hypothetical protein